MNDLYRQAVSLSFFAKGAAATVGVLIIHAAFRVLEKTLPRRFGRADARYRIRKLIVFSGYFSILLFLAFLFEDRLGRLGDRVQIGDTRGDVIDIGLLRTTLMETGNWVSQDLYNGRIARIPNSTVLRGSVFNYSQGFRFVWDEINVLLKITSDCQLAKAMLLRAANEAIGEYLVEAQSSWKVMSDNYQSANPPLEPTVALVVNAGSLEFTVSYVVDYTKRTAMKDQLFTKIAEEVANSDGRLEWASSAVIPMRPPGDAGHESKALLPSSSTLGVGHAADSH